MTLKTWKDIERAAIGMPWDDTKPHDLTLIYGEPLLYRAVVAAGRGEMTREEALIQVVLALVQVKNEQMKMILDYVAITPRAPFVMKDPR